MMIHLCVEQRNSLSSKLLMIIVIGGLMLAPLDSFEQALKNSKSHTAMVNQIKEGPTLTQKEFPIEKALKLFQFTPYRGRWQKSIKRSTFLKQQSGLFEIRCERNYSKALKQNHLRITIYDGQYRDNGAYDIFINISSIIVKEKFDKSVVFYETIIPIVGNLKKGNSLLFEKEQSIFINKLKIKLQMSEVISFQVLFSSQYNINVVVRNMTEYWQSFHDILFAVFLIIQCILEMRSLCLIFQQIISRNQSAEKYSFFSILAATVADSVIGMYIISLCLSSLKRFSIYFLPAVIFALKIFSMEMHTLWTIMENNNQSLVKMYVLIYGSIILGCFIAYFSDMHAFMYVIYSLLVMFPQIIHNFLVGHRMKAEFKTYLSFAVPRYAIIAYMKMFPANVFQMQPDYILSIVCLLIITVQIFLLKIQKQYGVRSILPKFLYSSEFKYFVNEPEAQDSECSICLVSLKLMAPAESESELNVKLKYNRVVETPCKHKFHLKCLTSWMQSKLQCPNCRRMLPPVEECEV